MNFNIADLVIQIPVLLLALTAHEFAHGYVAYRLGDPTAKSLGRRITSYNVCYTKLLRYSRSSSLSNAEDGWSAFQRLSLHFTSQNNNISISGNVFTNG